MTASAQEPQLTTGSSFRCLTRPLNVYMNMRALTTAGIYGPDDVAAVVHAAKTIFLGLQDSEHSSQLCTVVPTGTGSVGRRSIEASAIGSENAITRERGLDARECFSFVEGRSIHNSFLQQPFRNGCLESYFRRLVLNN